MGVLSRDYALSVPEPALTTLWRVMIPFGNSVTHLLAESVTLTWLKVPTEPVFSGGKHVYFPGMAEVDGLAITFYETHDYQVSKWLENWQMLVYNVDSGVYGVPAQFKKEITVNLFSKVSTKPIKIVTYNGCWPTDKGPYELNYQEETGRIVIQAQFAVDKVK